MEATYLSMQALQNLHLLGWFPLTFEYKTNFFFMVFLPYLYMMCVCVVCMYIYIYIFGVKIAPLQTTRYEQKLITTTPKNLKVLDVMVNVARSVSILRRHVNLKTLMGISTIFERELKIATQILLFINFTVAPVLNTYRK